MTTLATGQPIPFYALGADVLAEDPKALFAIINFGAGTEWTGDLLSLMEQRRIKSIRTLYVDLINCANDVTLLFPQTQQRIVLPAGGWGYIPVIVTSQAQFVLTGTAPDVLRVHFLNKDFDPIIYDPVTTIPSGDVIMTASPRLLGRFSPGAGPAEEISLTAPFSIAGGAFSAQAAAQFNVLGRRTAGAGAYEDSTRTQLNIAGTDLANAFTQAQTITNNGFTLLTIDRPDDGATGPRFVIRHTSNSPAVSDLVGAIDFQAYDSAAALTLAARLSGVATNVTTGSYSASYVFGTSQAGVFAGRISIGGGLFSTGIADPGIGNASFAGFMKPGTFTVATLPAAGASGAFAMAGVTDALGPAFGALVVGGGAVVVPVYSDGAAWRVG